MDGNTELQIKKLKDNGSTVTSGDNREGRG